MPQEESRFARWSRAWLGIWVVLPVMQPAGAQSAEPRDHAYISPAHVGTPLSAQIEAEAKYLIARGDLIESVAVARRIHAEAVAQEIQNAVDYVDAYFKRRELNRQWRSKERPNYLARREYVQNVIKKRMRTQFQDILEGDVTSELNWLLAELSGPTLAYRYLPGDQSLADSEFDQKLSPEAIAQIMLSDNGGEGSRLVFSAADPKVLETRWPTALRSPGFKTACDRFEAARDEVLRGIRADGQVSHADGEKLIKAVDDLFVALEQTYPQEKRRAVRVFLTYNGAKRYLQSLAAQAHRTINANDPSLFDGSLRFEGDSLIDLIRYMCQAGLVFAPPEAGGERVYRSLITGVRSIYLAFNPEDPALNADLR